MMLSRLVAGLCVMLGSAAALGAAWLIWQAPHCRPVVAHAYYTPLAAAQCGREAPVMAKEQAWRAWDAPDDDTAA